jgi:hypothetical protein
MTTKDTGSNKEHIQGTNAKGGQDDGDLRQTQHREGTKTAKAYEVWDKLHKKDPHVARSICIEAAQSEADMTPASASTIYQAWRTENGYVNNPEMDNRTSGSNDQHAGNKPGTPGNTAGATANKK